MEAWEWPRAICVTYDTTKNFGHSARDGDTFRVDVDLGADLIRRGLPVRLIDVWAPELWLPGSVEARDALRALLPVGTKVSLTSLGYDKYNPRVDAIVIRKSDNVNVNTEMLKFLDTVKGGEKK